MKGVAARVNIPGVSFETKNTQTLSIGYENIIDNVGTFKYNVGALHQKIHNIA